MTMNFFKKEKRNALESLEYAQWIAHAPMVFMAARLLRNSGILEAVMKAGENTITLASLCSAIPMSPYGIRVLVESGLGAGLLLENEGRITITKAGIFILSDTMTRVNMDFVHDVCYQGLFDLEASIANQKPEGLKHLGGWGTLYEGLATMPEPAKTSWLSYDHFYSDNAFEEALPLVFKHQPKKLLDIGGNTGKWATACAQYNADVHVTMADLPGQLEMARHNIQNQPFAPRIAYHPINMLDEAQALPGGHDAIWMSQFLDCFSEEEIIAILRKCARALAPGGKVFIMELLWDRQRFEAAAFSLQQCSLYFTTMANGNSQMYRSEVFLKCLEAADFEVVEEENQVGTFQSLLVCKRKAD